MSNELAGRFSSMSNGKIAEVLSYLIKESIDDRRTFLHNLWTCKVKVLVKKKSREQTTADAAPIPQNSIFQNPIFSEPLPCTSSSYVPVLPEDRRENSAKQSAFIFKPEKIGPNHTLFLDIEIIDLVKLLGEKTYRKHPGEVATVNDSGDLILWARAKIAHENVCNYFTAISGIEPEFLVNATPFFIVKPAIEYLLETAYLVGLNLQESNTVFHPEVLSALENAEAVFKGIEVLHIAKDEGHCVSQWYASFF